MFKSANSIDTEFDLYILILRAVFNFEKKIEFFTTYISAYIFKCISNPTSVGILTYRRVIYSVIYVCLFLHEIESQIYNTHRYDK